MNGSPHNSILTCLAKEGDEWNVCDYMRCQEGKNAKYNDSNGKETQKCSGYMYILATKMSFGSDGKVSWSLDLN
jgi:hypothetical protein